MSCIKTGLVISLKEILEDKYKGPISLLASMCSLGKIPNYDTKRLSSSLQRRLNYYVILASF